MVDTVSEKKRSEIMKASKPKGNKSTELKLIQIFKENDVKGWRRNYKIAESSPDFVFIKKKIAIFVDGCFWHGHNCRSLRPKTNQNYWDEKISKNKERDQNIKRKLEDRGWIVFRIWECEIKKQVLPDDFINLLNK